MGLSCTVSEINGNISRKSHNFPAPCILPSYRMDSPWNWVPALGVQKSRMMWLPGRERSLTMSQTLGRLDTMHQRDGQTDGHWATANSALRVTSRGKNWQYIQPFRFDGQTNNYNGRTDASNWRAMNTGKKRRCSWIWLQQLRELAEFTSPTRKVITNTICYRSEWGQNCMFPSYRWIIVQNSVS